MTTVAEVLHTVDQTVGEGPFAASWESLSGYQVPDWYRDSKFGIFIHWGPWTSTPTCAPAGTPTSTDRPNHRS
jgi:hypothetical protein